MFFLLGEVLIEHIQAMSFLKNAPDRSVEWNSEARDVFDVLARIALRFYDSTFEGLYITAAIIVGLTTIFYLITNKPLHRLHKSKNFAICLLVWFFEHILFGIGYIPLLSQFVEVEYCRVDGKIERFSDITCWEKKHMTMVVVGYILAGFTLFISGVICAAFKSERNGIERKFGNESYFLGMYKLLLFGVVFLLGPIHDPVPGIVLTVLVIAYLFVYEAYAELFVASTYMAVLVGQLWVFICAATLENESYGSDMLAAWIPFIVLGFAILPLKSLVYHRVPKVLPVEKQ
jgi:hypothetical protein